MNNITRISFDFDETLSKKSMQILAKCLMSNPLVEVWIITSRCKMPESFNSDLFLIANELDIPNERIIFTESSHKHGAVMKHNIDIHYDDMPDEVHHINRLTNCQALLVWNECTVTDVINILT